VQNLRHTSEMKILKTFHNTKKFESSSSICICLFTGFGFLLYSGELLPKGVSLLRPFSRIVLFCSIRVGFEPSKWFSFVKVVCSVLGNFRGEYYRIGVLFRYRTAQRTTNVKDYRTN